MIIVYNYKNKRPFIIIGKKKSGSLPDEPENPEIPDLPDGVLPEVTENEDILAIKNVDTTEGTVYMRNPNNISIQYSTNGTEFNKYTTASEVPIGVGEKVYFKWSDVLSRETNSTALVSSNVKYKTYGELKKGNESNAYHSMFRDESNLTDASQLKLSATQLAYQSYNYMFRDCTSLTTAPELPATTLENSCYDGMFYGCTSLTTAPELPATTLADKCYFGMFQNCTAITKTPELPATTTKANCYYNMFRGCTSLTTAPALPATTLESQCYISMFNGCTSLTTAPALPATTLEPYCYQNMFEGCTSLTTAPELPATTLKYACYQSMFEGCTSLTTAPALSATTLKSECYSFMFQNCSSLVQAPELPATTLATNCYRSMFNGCTSLNYVKHNITDWNTSYTNNWLSGVAPSGTVECPANSTIPNNNTSGIPTGWIKIDENGNVIPDEPSLPEVAENEDILVIENVDTTEGTVLMRNPNNIAIQYSTNGTEFNEYTTATEVPIGVGDKVYFKWSEVISKSSNSTIVSSNVKYKVSGELKKGNTSNAYYRMFRNESNLTDASQLQLTATTLAERCYSFMFYNCTKLTTAPTVLPATTLAPYCYSYMFEGCKALTTAPELPATKLSNDCYYNMFYNCTKLTTAPTVLPATTLAPYCYKSMFEGCTSLTTAPELPATKLTNYCYGSMFGGCSSLSYVKHHIVSWSTSNASSWLSGVASSGTVYCPLNSTIPNNTTSGIPSGWLRVAIE